MHSKKDTTAHKNSSVVEVEGMSSSTINSSARGTASIHDLLKMLKTHQHGWVFATPVDPISLDMPGYFDIITTPMDFSTIQNKINAGTYQSVDDFKHDVYLTFNNAMKYYTDKDAQPHIMAREMMIFFGTTCQGINIILDSTNSTNSNSDNEGEESTDNENEEDEESNNEETDYELDVESMTINTSDAVYEYRGRFNGTNRLWNGVPKDVVKVRVHPSIVEVEHFSFRHCKHLKEVVLNEGIQKIGDQAFIGCTSLESITLPSTVTEIGVFAFTGCKNLRNVSLNEGLKVIGNMAFANCKSLEIIEIPSTITEMGKKSFMKHVIFVSA